METEVPMDVLVIPEVGPQRVTHEPYDYREPSPRVQFTADASDLGLAPGVWPGAIEYEGIEFRAVRELPDGGRDYSSGEAIFRVWND